MTRDNGTQAELQLPAILGADSAAGATLELQHRRALATAQAGRDDRRYRSQSMIHQTYERVYASFNLRQKGLRSQNRCCGHGCTTDDHCESRMRIRRDISPASSLHASKLLLYIHMYRLQCTRWLYVRVTVLCGSL